MTSTYSSDVFEDSSPSQSHFDQELFCETGKSRHLKNHSRVATRCWRKALIKGKWIKEVAEQKLGLFNSAHIFCSSSPSHETRGCVKQLCFNNNLWRIRNWSECSWKGCGAGWGQSPGAGLGPGQTWAQQCYLYAADSLDGSWLVITTV